MKLKVEGCSSSLACLCCCPFSTRCVCVFQGPTSPPTWIASRSSSHLWCAAGCALEGVAIIAARRETWPRSTARPRHISSRRTRASDSVSVDPGPLTISNACLPAYLCDTALCCPWVSLVLPFDSHTQSVFGISLFFLLGELDKMGMLSVLNTNLRQEAEWCRLSMRAMLKTFTVKEKDGQGRAD